MISFSSSLLGANQLAGLISETTGLDWKWMSLHLNYLSHQKNIENSYRILTKFRNWTRLRWNRIKSVGCVVEYYFVLTPVNASIESKESEEISFRVRTTQ
jgi:hypothetical protein